MLMRFGRFFAPGIPAGEGIAAARLIRPPALFLLF
jgi:hypothetical protein